MQKSELLTAGFTLTIVSMPVAGFTCRSGSMASGQNVSPWLESAFLNGPTLRARTMHKEGLAVYINGKKAGRFGAADSTNRTSSRSPSC